MRFPAIAHPAEQNRPAPSDLDRVNGFRILAFAPEASPRRA